MTSGAFRKTAGKIKLNSIYIEEVCRIILNNPLLKERVDALEDHARRTLFSDLSNYNDLLKTHFNTEHRMLINLYFAVCFAGDCELRYLSARIDPEIYIDTMGDIEIWVGSYYERTGCVGLEAVSWIRRHLKFEVFKLGRLQFELGVLQMPVNNYPEGAKCLNIHIPEGEKLDVAKCRESIRRVKTFFRRHLGYEYSIAVCHSWLLHGNLKDLLEEDSNISGFARLFEIIDNDDDASQIIERVFGPGEVVSQELPEKTTLQRKLKRYLLTGHRIGMGTGIIEF
ncbi:MAG: DUF5596 domain-containing protein [Spirochaetales bacterium]|nr:DUF5596 domain-containing protein [Spirochaetales bacterium]